MKKKKLVFFLGENSAEMAEIFKVLISEGFPIIYKQLENTTASGYKEEIQVVSSLGKTPVLVNLKRDMSLPDESILIGGDSVILQVLSLVNLQPNRYQQLVAANSDDYISGMLAINATPEEIASVCLAERCAKGVSSEDEYAAEVAISECKVSGRLTVVNLPHSEVSTVADRLFGQYNQLMIISSNGEVNFYGEKSFCSTLKEKFEGWIIGKNWWSGDITSGAVEFIREAFRPRVIVFGAPDIEEQRARKIAAEYGLILATATMGGEKCNPMTAYRADGFALDLTESVAEASECIIFECSPNAAGSLVVAAQCDHHNPGNFGFGLPPSQYLEASSLGQLLKFLGVEPSQKDKVIAAADHCLAAAYQGQCPGVTAQEVIAMRLPEIMKRENISSEAEAMAGIEAAVKLLKNPTKTVALGGVEVADIRDLGPIPFLVEAGVMTGTAYLAKGDKRFPDKVNLSGSKPVVAEFLGEVVMVEGRPTYPNGWAAKNGLFQAYGDAARGFAGAYDKIQA